MCTEELAGKGSDGPRPTQGCFMQLLGWEQVKQGKGFFALFLASWQGPEVSWADSGKGPAGQLQAVWAGMEGRASRENLETGVLTLVCSSPFMSGATVSACKVGSRALSLPFCINSWHCVNFRIS